MSFPTHDLRRCRPHRAFGLFALAVAVLFGLALPLAAQDVDTFHLRLYQDGAELAASGQHDEAVAKLRLACFGMLEAPKILGPCLGRLLASQEVGGASDDEIEGSVDRLLEVERRFKGWSEPDSRFVLADEIRRRVESLFGRFGTAESLARVPGLGDVALRKEVRRVAELPLDERRRELNLLVQRQARIPIWHVMSAELALAEGDPRAAAGAARQILEAFDGNSGARCVLGRARAAQEQCDIAVIDDLGVCPSDHPQRGEIDLALLSCLVDTERWGEADTVWRRMPVEVRNQRPIRRQRRQIEKGLEDQAQGGAAGAAATLMDAAMDAATDEMPNEVADEVTDSGSAATVSEASPERRSPSRPIGAPVYAPPPGIEEEDLLAAPAAGHAVSPIVSPTVSPRASPNGSTAPSPVSAAEFGDLSDDDQETLRQVRDALAAEKRHLYAELWSPIRKVAKRHDDSAVAQRLAGSLAFRLGRWKDAIRFLRRDESLSATRPQLQLELAVALHYQGKNEEARQAFEVCRPLLASSAWVEFWSEELPRT